MAGHLAIFDGGFFLSFSDIVVKLIWVSREICLLCLLRLEWWSWKRRVFFAADCKSYDLLEFQAPYYIIRDVIPLLPATASLMDFIDVLQYITLKKVVQH